MIKVAINGFGRIGRCALRLLLNDKSYKVVAINDLSDSNQLAYLFKYDSIYRTYNNTVTYDDNHIIVGKKKINVYKEKDPSLLPWKDLDVDVVLECTGAFTSVEKSMAHINAGAKKVIISAPSKDDCKTVVYNVNHGILCKSDKIISAASCTTNALAPVLNLIEKKYGIYKGFMTTVHAYTNDQEILDISHSKGISSRRGRAGALNTIPTSTGAASQIGKVIPSLASIMDGNAIRVPVGDGSLIDLTVVTKKGVTKEKVNELFEKNQSETIQITYDPVVSSDIIGSNLGALVDGNLTNVIDGNLLKVVAWYDNEQGYTMQMIRTMKALMK